MRASETILNTCQIPCIGYETEQALRLVYYGATCPRCVEFRPFTAVVAFHVGRPYLHTYSYTAFLACSLLYERVFVYIGTRVHHGLPCSSRMKKCTVVSYIPLPALNLLTLPGEDSPKGSHLSVRWIFLADAFICRYTYLFASKPSSRAG